MCVSLFKYAAITLLMSHRTLYYLYLYRIFYFQKDGCETISRGIKIFGKNK